MTRKNLKQFPAKFALNDFDPSLFEVAIPSCEEPGLMQ